MDASPTDATIFDWRSLDRLPLVALVVANLIPLFGVFLLDWDVAGLLILYWLENLVVGFYTLLKMLHVGGLAAIFPGAFFLVHYGGFCAVHGIFIVVFSGLGEPGFGDPEMALGPLVFLQLLWNVIAFVGGNAPDFFYLPLLALFVSHGISFFMHHVRGGEDTGRRVSRIMGDPYKRIVILHVAILAGGFAAMHFGAPTGMLLVLVLLKIGLDLYLHRRSHAARRG